MVRASRWRPWNRREDGRRGHSKSMSTWRNVGWRSRRHAAAVTTSGFIERAAPGRCRNSRVASYMTIERFSVNGRMFDTPRRVERTAAGSVARTWTVTVPATASGGAAQLFEAAAFSVPGSAVHEEASASSAVSVPYSSLAAAFDDAGITSDAAPGVGNIDGPAYSFSAQALAAAGARPGGTITSGGLTFRWPATAASEPDNVVADGQAFLSCH
jgi:hypothetical protein